MEAMIKSILEETATLPSWSVVLFFFLSAILQMTFPPYPGDTVLVFGGYIGSTARSGSAVLILLSYLLGTIAGSYLLYEIGLSQGERFLKARLIKKYFPEPYHLKARAWIVRHGVIIFFISKFIPGLSSLLIIFGGIFRYKRFWAYIGMGFAALIHNLLLFQAGRMIGNHWDRIAHFLSVYNKVVIILLLSILMIYGFNRFWAKGRRKKAPLS